MSASALPPAGAAARSTSARCVHSLHTAQPIRSSNRNLAVSWTQQQQGRGSLTRAHASSSSTVTKQAAPTMPGAVSTMSPADLHAQLDNLVLVVDVRSQERYVCSGHIPCPRSLNTSPSDLPAILAAQQLATTRRIDLVALVADDTSQALQAALLLVEQGGFLRVVALEGGFPAWAAADLPIEYGTDCETIQMHCPWLEGSDQGCPIDGADAMEQLMF